MRPSVRVIVAALALCVVAPAAIAQKATFKIIFDDSVCAEPYTGRVYVAFSRPDPRRQSEPRMRMGSWFSPPPLLALDVEDVPVGGSVLVGESALSHPIPLDEIEPGKWEIQGVARMSLDSPNPGRGAGDLYSNVVTIEIGDEHDDPISLVLKNTVEPRKFPESREVKHFQINSKLLSEFHGRPVTMHAGVILPDGWAENPTRRYPIVYHSTGFGGSHFGAPRQADRLAPDSDARKCINVVIDATCYRGHSVFADSANNGPWGTALVTELIPALEKKYRGPLNADYRFVTGGSSGGWASLWLQVMYPDDFGSCFSHVPDPVDFRDFQRINLYKPGTNMFVDENGKRRPLARSRGNVAIWYDDFVGRETVLGPGGQISSFEACFSPRGDDGEPMPVFDRKTGAVNTKVAKAWEAYDIRLILERDWEQLEPSLAGKIHVYAGEVDTFYLEGAARLLKESVDGLAADAEVRIIDGMAHQGYEPGSVKMYETLLKRWKTRGLNNE